MNFLAAERTFLGSALSLARQVRENIERPPLGYGLDIRFHLHCFNLDELELVLWLLTEEQRKRIAGWTFNNWDKQEPSQEMHL